MKMIRRRIRTRKEGMLLKRLFVAAVLAIALAGSAHAGEERACLEKTWKGTIGEVPVMMQFTFQVVLPVDSEDSGFPQAGRYYYRTSLVDFILIRDRSKPDQWKELDPKGNVSGCFTLTCRGDTLEGTWSSPDGSRTLPVHAGSEPDESYTRQRLVGLKTTVESASIDGRRYELFKARDFGSVEGLRLIGSGRAVADINHVLMERFRSSLEEGIDCVAAGRIRRGAETEDEDREEEDWYQYEYALYMIAWNREFVVIGQSMSQYCGGMHPDVWSGATVYSLRTGKSEDMSLWLVEKYRKDIPKESALGTMLLDLYRREEVKIFPTKDTGDEDECPEAIGFSGEDLWPTPAGITFRPDAPYSRSACIVDVNVPYAKMAPYLSPLGKSNAKAFRRR